MKDKRDRKEEKRKYYMEHRLEINAAWRKYYAEHREEQVERAKRYNANHREQNRAHTKRYYEAHKEELNAKAKVWREKNKDRLLAYKKNYHNTHRAQWREWKYKLSPVEYDALFQSQGGLCAICGSEPTTPGVLHVDHDHMSGETRGLLCGKCNSALGLMDDDTDRMQKAIEYLERFTEKEKQA